MDSQQQKPQAPMVGGSSLLVIFAVLCLTVFALLAISTVQADDRLSRASVEAVTAYYEADCEAERVLAQLREGKLVDGVYVGNNTYRYVIRVSDTQQLFAEVAVRGENDWDVLCWRTVSTTQSQAEGLLNVWIGDF